VGDWRGSVSVESIDGQPTCIAPFWRVGATDIVSAIIEPAAGSLDAVIVQQAADDCHVQIGSAQDHVSARPWPYDEFDCLLVPAVCNLRCHFRLRSETWQCQGPPPDVWILGIRLQGTLDGSQRRMQGTMAIDYDHRPGQGVAYRTMTVLERFDIEKIVR
jgi:hypothetical protein